MTQTFKLHIDTGNAAFNDDAGGAAAEVARILRDVADRIENNDDLPSYRGLHDVNGNRVGEASTSGERADDET